MVSGANRWVTIPVAEAIYEGSGRKEPWRRYDRRKHCFPGREKARVREPSILQNGDGLGWPEEARGLWPEGRLARGCSSQQRPLLAPLGVGCRRDLTLS